MENIITKKEYSFKEKFFDFKKEKRINRYQFLARLFGIGILIGLITYGITFAINQTMPYSNDLKTYSLIKTISIIYDIIWGIAGIFYIISWFYLASKRDNDIGKKLSPSIRLSSLFLIGTIIINNFLGPIFSNTDADSIIHGIAYNITLLLIFTSILGVFAFFNIIITIILLFYPGKKGDNEFGEDPINTKTGFLG